MMVDGKSGHEGRVRSFGYARGGKKISLFWLFFLLTDICSSVKIILSLSDDKRHPPAGGR